jgi:hypothetical protein
MFSFPIINVVIGLVFLFLLYSLFVTSLQEGIASLLQRRARTLYDGIKTMLSNTPDRQIPRWLLILEWTGLGAWLVKKATDNKNIALLANRAVAKKDHETAVHLYELFYNHPIIKNYGQSDLFSKPSYIPDRNFSSILVDVIKNLDPANANVAASFQNVKQAFEQNKDKIEQEVADIISYYLNEAAGDLDVFKQKLQTWFNDTMDRVSGWYKRHTHYWLFGLGLGLALCLNVDTIAISNLLSKDQKAADQLATMGTAAAGNNQLSGKDSVITREALDTIRNNMRTVNTLLGLGWGDYGRTDSGFIVRLKNGKRAAKDYAAAAAFFTKNKDSIFQVLTGYIAPPRDTAAKTALAARPMPQDSATLALLAKAQKADSAYARFNSHADSLTQLVFFDREIKAHKYRVYTAYVWYALTWTKLFGFLITAIAISLGAPFWFDLLNKLVSLRSTGKVINSGTQQTNNTNNPEIDG